MKNVNTLPLADPTINEPCQVDFPLGADILEDGVSIQILAETRTQFGIPDCRNQVRKFISHDVICDIFNSISRNPLLGPLPKQRITVPSKASQHVDLVFEVPLFVKPTVTTSQKHI